MSSEKELKEELRYRIERTKFIRKNLLIIKQAIENLKQAFEEQKE